MKVLLFSTNPSTFPLEYHSDAFMSSWGADSPDDVHYIVMGTGIDPNVILGEKDIINIFAVSNVIEGELQLDSRLFKNWNGMLNTVSNPLQNCTKEAALMAVKIIEERLIKTFLIL